MWSRTMLKTRAKAVLKQHYWKAFLVSLAVLFAGGSAEGAPLNLTLNWGGGGSSQGTSGLGGGVNWDWLIYMIVGIVILIAVVFALAFRIFLGFPLEVSGRRFFKQTAVDGSADLNHLGYAFNKATYSLVVRAMLLRGFYIVLWYLLLIVPGIVKTYAYSMVPYILADNPHIGTKRAIELSDRMTDGQKWRMFVLDLSFLGWYLLGVLLFGVGVLFVMPYVYAAYAELYVVLRERAMQQGFCTHDELRLV